MAEQDKLEHVLIESNDITQILAKLMCAGLDFTKVAKIGEALLAILKQAAEEPGNGHLIDESAARALLDSVPLVPSVELAVDLSLSKDSVNDHGPDSALMRLIATMDHGSGETLTAARNAVWSKLSTYVIESDSKESTAEQALNSISGNEWESSRWRFPLSLLVY